MLLSNCVVANNATADLAIHTGGIITQADLSSLGFIRRLENTSLINAFTNAVKLTGGTSWEEAIYKQLLLDVMDNYIDKAFEW